ncbi:uncharacterized protein LOC62_07G008901 [Vanrija pseudolonga]|uniref:BRCT domain-containing protein n=1 Tax=Vanrija pseudolonga TaxID=143232 RepID=A0AAF0YFI5_9TREE|nr:hypothetical protein LOC62_07G008901 [Vanrija pseudolonga]
MFAEGLDAPVSFYLDAGCSAALEGMVKADGGNVTTFDRAQFLVFNVTSVADLDRAQTDRLLTERRYFGGRVVTQEWLIRCIVAREVTGLRENELVVGVKTE